MRNRLNAGERLAFRVGAYAGAVIRVAFLGAAALAILIYLKKNL